MSKKHNPHFIDLLKKHVSLNEETGQLKFDGLYAQIAINIGWLGGVVVAPYSHIVWLLKHGSWPKEDIVLDHIDNDPTNNRPINLQEITQEENQKKRRGRMVYRSYGTGKYGHGIYIHHDKRDDRYYVTRHLSRGHGEGDLKSVRKGLGGFDTLEGAEVRVKECISKIEQFGEKYLPDYEKGKKRSTIQLEAQKDVVRRLRSEGKTFDEIREITGLKSVYKLAADIKVKKNIGENNPSAKLNETKVRAIRAMRKNGCSITAIAEHYSVTEAMISRIVLGKAWGHVT